MKSQDLADDSRMGYDSDSALRMTLNQPAYSAEAAGSKLAVALTARPTKVLVLLSKVGSPELWKAVPNLVEREPVQLTAVDFL